MKQNKIFRGDYEWHKKEITYFLNKLFDNAFYEKILKYLIIFIFVSL